MLAKIKATGEIIEVSKRTSHFVDEGMTEIFYVSNVGAVYFTSDLDFLPEKETAVLEGWVARDMDGGLFLYPFKPYRKSAWFAIPKDEEYNAAMQIDKSLFPSVTWQSEPKKVKIELTPIEE